jgi:hypothetical protein
MISNIIISWNDLYADYNIIDGVKIIDSYTEGCFLFCNSNTHIHYVVIQYDRTTIENVYLQDGVINIKLREEYKFYGKKSKIYQTFKTNLDYFEANIIV